MRVESEIPSEKIPQTANVWTRNKALQQQTFCVFSWNQRALHCREESGILIGDLSEFFANFCINSFLAHLARKLVGVVLYVTRSQKTVWDGWKNVNFSTLSYFYLFFFKKDAVSHVAKLFLEVLYYNHFIQDMLNTFLHFI